MNIKPHIKNGRFYNNETDSIRSRVKNTLKALWFIAKTRSKNFIVDIYKNKEQKKIIHEWTESYISFAQRHKDIIITWLGHATFLVQINHINILIDPVFYNISAAAPRFLNFPIHPSELPPIDIVLISHNHKDHLDAASIKTLAPHNPHFYVPHGNKKWFLKRGITNVTEMTWWDDALFCNKDGQSVTVTFLPASHWTSRGIFDINKTLWGSWMISNMQKNIYCAGDTAYDKHFSDIKKHFGTIDIALMPIGPAEPRELIAESHMGPEEAVQAFLELDASHFIPMHWGTFMFGIDSFILPIERLKIAWEKEQKALTVKKLHIVKIGQHILYDAQATIQQQQLEGL